MGRIEPEKKNKMPNDNERERRGGKKRKPKTPAHQLVSALRKCIHSSIRGH